MLVDSNIIIYAALPEYPQLRQFIREHEPVVSAISYVEVLGFHRLTEPDRVLFSAYFADATMLPVNQAVIDKAVILRQMKKISLGDALIAATCLAFDHVLVTRNTSDFEDIPDLDIVNPVDTP